jgi:UDP-N-acetylmuramate: L-alanyl-gamma-D-glutamyl-meso-diaminopimelate ligase
MRPGNNRHIHFIAIGGSTMHNLAIALAQQGYQVTGSDDDIFEPSRTRLSVNHLLPSDLGWDPDRITNDIEAVILGMHARSDNPELLKARKIGLKIYSFPDYIYELKKRALRIVIAGSHGKTTITSMIAYALMQFGKDFDYLIGAGLSGFENMVKISNAPVMVLEGDEYLSSALDRTPKFIRYHHHIGLLSGISWDHINAFPTRKDYIDPFRKFINSTPEEGHIIYNEEDELVKQLIEKYVGKYKTTPYSIPKYEIINEQYHFIYETEKIPLKIFGKHNMSNMAGVMAVLNVLGYSDYDSIQALKSFSGAANRLEKVYDRNHIVIYKDFAHSPSKLRSTIQAVKELYPRRKIINCYELHTFSSLNKNFLPEYKNTLYPEDINVIFLNNHTLKIKRMEYLEDEMIRDGFLNKNLYIFRNKEDLVHFLIGSMEEYTALLMMSSGNFGGLDFKQLIKYLQLKF